MPTNALVELRDLQIKANIGTYGPDDVIPDEHLLDLTLTIKPNLVLVHRDAMNQVFDYDPLVAQIEALAASQHYETQEFLMTRIVHACAGYKEVLGVDISLRKRPVRRGTGSLGVRLVLGPDDLAVLRPTAS